MEGRSDSPLHFLYLKRLFIFNSRKIGKIVNSFIMKCVPNKSDFKFRSIFKDSDGIAVNPLDFDWEFFYYTSPHVQYTATHKIDPSEPSGHKFTPNIIVVDEQTIDVLVNGFDFTNKGVVKFKSIFHFVNPEFPDSIQTVPSVEKLLEISIV